MRGALTRHLTDMKAMIPAGFVAIAGTLVLLAATVAPRPGANVLIVYPPDISPVDAFTTALSAGWTPVSAPRPHLLLASPAESQTEKPVGAWFVLDALGLRGCTIEGALP